MIIRFRNELIIATIAAVALSIVLFVGPISQDAAYHQFADQRTLFGLPNALNVVSNAPFVLVGLAGAVFLARLLRRSGFNALLMVYMVFFAGVFCTGFGSMYYHFRPSNESLLWDRLPMTVAFMAFLSSVISERISGKAGAALLAPLLALGIFSVLYWAWGERAGHGDLRMYAAVQFIPVLLTPVVLLLYRPPKAYAVAVGYLFALYLAAKLLEHFDRAVFDYGHIVSGHTLKHIFAALGIACVLKMLRAREKEFI